MTTALLTLAAWMILSLPLGILVGKWIKRNNGEPM